MKVIKYLGWMKIVWMFSLVSAQCCCEIFTNTVVRRGDTSSNFANKALNVPSSYVIIKKFYCEPSLTSLTSHTLDSNIAWNHAMIMDFFPLLTQYNFHTAPIIKPNIFKNLQWRVNRSFELFVAGLGLKNPMFLFWGQDESLGLLIIDWSYHQYRAEQQSSGLWCWHSGSHLSY